MNASMVPLEAASKHSNGGMIWPPGETSIRNRPPLVSSTTFASRWAAPCTTSSAGVKVVDMRHWIFGCAMTLGASKMAAAATVAAAPLAVAMNLRRAVITLSSAGLRQDATPRSLLDDLIRSQQQRRRDGEAERLGSFEVDHQLELRGLLNREITGLCTLKDLIY